MKTTYRRAARHTVTSRGTRGSKAQAVIDAAIAEFIRKGYEGANVRSILAASGASAGSVYRRFGSKEGLFREIIQERIDLSYARTERLQARGRPMEEELAQFARAYLRDFLNPDTLSGYAMIIGEAEHFPEETRRLWELGPRKALGQVEDYLRHHRNLGTIEVENVALAAAQFLDMIKGGLHLRCLLTGWVPSPREINASARQATRIFCRGIAARR